MASEGVPAQISPSAPAPVPQSTQPVHSVLHTTQPESDAITVEDAGSTGMVDHAESLHPQLPHAPPTEASLDGPIAPSEPEAPVAAQVEQAKTAEEPKGDKQPTVEDQSEVEEVEKEAPQTGKKRDLDSATTSAPAPGTEDKEEAAPPAEKTGEPEAKKQKLETDLEPTKEPVQEPEAPAPAPTDGANGDSNGDPKKPDRSKKEKVKEVIKKAVSTDGIGSRTRSRTKGA